MSIRHKLGSHVSLVERSHVYLVDQSLEVESSSGVTIERSKLFFEDIRMITWHEHYQRALIWAMGIICVLELGGYFIKLVRSGDPGAFIIETVVFLILFAPFLACFLISARKRLRVTVFGRRNRAVMQWTWNYAQGKAVFDELSRLIEAAQTAKRDQLASQGTLTSERFYERPNDPFASVEDALAALGPMAGQFQDGPEPKAVPWVEPVIELDSGPDHESAERRP